MMIEKENSKIKKTSKKKSVKNKKEQKQKTLNNARKYVNDLSDDIKEQVLVDLAKLLPKFDVKIEKRWPGQPPVITEDKLQVLKVYLAWGMKVKKALFLAKIEKSTFYDYLKRNPEFSEELKYVRESIDDQALLNMWFAVKAEKKLIDRHIKENKDWPIQIPNTKFWLTSKHKDFKNKLQVDATFSLVDFHKKLNPNLIQNEWPNEESEFERELFWWAEE